MNGNTQTATAAGSVSPCDEAYDDLQRELSAHEELLDKLIVRLGAALRDPLPQIPDGSGPKAVENPAQSEIHGRLIGSAKRVRQQNNALDEVLRRLTL